MKPIILKILCSFIFFLAVLACNSQNKESNLNGKSKFGPLDTSLPVLKPGFYLLSKVKKANTVYRKFYIALDEDPTGGKEFYYIVTKVFVDFSNVDSIFSKREKAPYEKYYIISLVLNDTGRKQFLDLTNNCKTLTEKEKYDGLLIGTVINNSLLQVVHVHEPIDTNIIEMSGVSFFEENVNDLKKILEKGRNKK